MKTVLKGLTTAALMAAVMAVPAGAQQKSWGFGVNGAYFKSGTLAKGPTDTRLQLDNKRSIGFNLEIWPGSGRVGIRADATKTNSPWILENHKNPSSAALARDQATLQAAVRNVDVWLADADLMIRLFRPTVDRRFAPFVSVGGGFVRWDHQQIKSGANPATLDLQVREPDAQIYGKKQSEPAIKASIGTDFFLTDNVALRLEAKDYYNWSSPYIQLSDLSGDKPHHGGTHNLLYSAGLAFLFGGGVEEPGFIAAAPAPAPVVVAAPPPPPPPAPTTESVSMCVVDQNGRLSMVTGTRRFSNNQIYVTRNGTDVLFSTAYPVSEPHYIKGAPWYVAARPLVLNLDANDMGGDVDDELDDAAEKLPENRMEFVNFGATQPLPMGDVLYVGTIDGTPLYAKRSDIGGLLPDLEAKLRVTTDLDDVLDDKAFATRFATEIETFYTVVEPGSSNCVFQPMSSTHVVRRTRG